MKPAQIFHQYIWIINTLRAYRKLTLEELNQKWIADKVADGNPLLRSSFNRHRSAPTTQSAAENEGNGSRNS